MHLLSNPVVWTRFNEAAEPYKDQASGAMFNAATAVNPYVTGTLTANNTGAVVCQALPMPAGTLRLLQIRFSSAPAVGNQITFAMGNQTGSTITLVGASAFTITTQPNTTLQTYFGGTDFSPVAVTSGQLLCAWQIPSDVGPGYNSGTGTNSWGFASSTLPVGPQTYSALGSHVALYGFVDAGAQTSRQPGFDATLQNNYSVAFPPNTLVAAPNTSLGDFEWSTPSSIYLHIDNLQYNQAAGAGAPLILASKYDGAEGWQLYINPNGLGTQLCFAMFSKLSWGPGNVVTTTCSSNTDNALLPGYGLDILFVNQGTGWPSDNQLYINGQIGGANTGGPVNTAQNNFGLGAAKVTASGGSGYTDPSTSFTSTGGGAHCVISGNFVTSGGVATGTINTFQNSGCTSVPTLVPGGTGTGVSLVASLPAPSTSISTATTAPLMVGAVTSDASQSAVNIDEFATFNTALATTDAVNIAYWTKFYQQILGPPPATPQLVLFDDDGKTDIDNQAAIALVIGLQKAGYVRIVGIVNEDYDGSCAAMWQQMMQQAGTNVPIGAAQTFVPSTGCNSVGQLAVYNASTPQASSNFLSAAQVYRMAFARYPTKSIAIIAAGALSGFSAFLQSPADSISSLTGAQLNAQNVTNGGFIVQQGITNCTPSAPPVPTPCTGSVTGTTPQAAYDSAASHYVYANLAGLPLFFTTGTPQNTGGVALYSRTSKDPFFLFTQALGDNRPGWDSLVVAYTVTHRFGNSLMASVSGGTGYATLTGITQTGGGAGCPTGLIGYMHATGGVPDNILTLSGQSINAASFGTYYGLGHTCTSVPTLSLVSPTGTGVTLTAYLNTFCGTISDTGPSGPNGTTNIASASCAGSNVTIVNPAPTAATIPEMPVFTYFSNSLVAPPPVPQPHVQ